MVAKMKIFQDSNNNEDKRVEYDIEDEGNTLEAFQTHFN